MLYSLNEFFVLLAYDMINKPSVSLSCFLFTGSERVCHPKMYKSLLDGGIDFSGYTIFVVIFSIAVYNLYHLRKCLISGTL